jgi:hypothetical protein
MQKSMGGGGPRPFKAAGQQLELPSKETGLSGIHSYLMWRVDILGTIPYR